MIVCDRCGNNAFLRAIHAAPGDVIPQLIYADYADESGQGRLADDLRLQRDRKSLLELWQSPWYGYGDGDGDGDGFGSGFGDGYGHGFGDGYGYGDGFGDGFGDGDGDGFGDGTQQSAHDLFGNEGPMTTGKAYLFITGFGWAWVGEYVGPNGLGTHAITRASNLCRTGGVSWFHLAKGQRRDQAVVRVIDGEVTIPTPAAIPWAGEVFTRDQN